MHYRFSARQAGSGQTIEIQLIAPAGELVDKLKLVLGKSLAQQGLDFDSLQYVGSIDTDFQGIVVPKCAVQVCEEIVDTPVTFHGWYSPTEHPEATNNKCVAHGCGIKSTYHLCKNHAVPGMVAEVGNTSECFVISTWLVERQGRMHAITINDYALGDLFGSRETFEKRLYEQGYKIHYLISSTEQLDDAKCRYPKLQMTPWDPNE